MYDREMLQQLLKELNSIFKEIDGYNEEGLYDHGYAEYLNERKYELTLRIKNMTLGENVEILNPKK